MEVMQTETQQLKNIIDSKEAEITTYQSTVRALQEEIKEVKEDNKKLAKQITDLKKEA